MSRLEYIPSNNTTQKGWNTFPRLSSPGHYVEPKIFSGFQNQRIKLTTVRRQPRVSTLRRLEEDEVLRRLSDEHGQATTSFIEDPKREESILDFSGLNWHPTGKILSGANDSTVEFSARLPTDKLQKESRPSQTKLHRSPSLFSMSPSAALLKPHRNTFDQSSKIRFHLNSKKSNKPGENIFRSSTMYVDVSDTSWSVIGSNDGSKSIRV